MTAVRNERGIALLVVLVVVALLTITVTEFTYSVQIDQHRTRNAMHSMQSQLLARSGVNIIEGFLMLDRDEDPYRGVTWRGEDWWLQLMEFCQGLQLDDGTLIRCKVEDESGKINVNATRPPINYNPDPNVATKDKVLRTAIQCILRWKVQDDRGSEKLLDYWLQEAPPREDGQPGVMPEFDSLEHWASVVGVDTTEQLPRLRPFLTALPTVRGRPLPINVNTASGEVLSAVLSVGLDEECGDDIPAAQELGLRQRSGEPIQRADISSLPHQGDTFWGAKQGLLGTDSNIYRLSSSALSNLDPENPDSGGIGQTLSEVVERRKVAAAGGRGGGGSGEQPLWTLRTLDWQKEGGARLFREPIEEVPSGMDDEGEALETGAQ
jgi:general secretion pathway protein K